MRAVLSLVMALMSVTAAADSTAVMVMTGQGEVNRTPDVVRIYVGVEQQAETASDALAANSDAAARVLGTLAEAGLSEEDLQTTQFAINPVYDNRNTRPSGVPDVVGYRVTNQVVARLRDVQGLGALLDRLVTVGANRINGIQFGLDDDAAALDEARGLAVADAKHKAGIYAKAAGVTLGPILSITEAGAGGVPGPMMMEARSSAVPIAAGTQQVSASVTITWQIGSGD